MERAQQSPAILYRNRIPAQIYNFYSIRPPTQDYSDVQVD